MTITQTVTVSHTVIITSGHSNRLRCASQESGKQTTETSVINMQRSDSLLTTPRC